MGGGGGWWRKGDKVDCGEGWIGARGGELESHGTGRMDCIYLSGLPRGGEDFTRDGREAGDLSAVSDEGDGAV